METKCGVAMIDNLADSIPAKTSCLEKIEVEEADEIGVLEGTEVKVEKVETGIKFVSSKTHCWKNASDVAELDITICQHDRGIDIAPTTPSSDREMLELLSSSETCEKDLESGCQTPRESIFDPFAPGPEELLFAPKRMLKIRDGLFSRQLNFDLYSEYVKHIESNVSEDVKICLQIIYGLTLLFQVQEISAPKLLIEPSSSDLIKTSNFLPFLSGIAETYPDPPVRPTFQIEKLSSHCTVSKA